ncbi:helix-turn-helix transcriptional regulator [Vibrio sp.]|uniref:helix-turn-helix transcriptional regulator n=1 Tax=Vibrio sp. TaxID=678 RepID=UPI003D13BBCD
MSIIKLASRGWYHSIGNVTEQLHQSGFPQALIQAFQRAFTFDSALILIYRQDSVPEVVIEQDISGRIEKKGEMRYYVDGIYLLDPFYQLAMQQPQPGLYTLKDVAPDHFMRSEFYRRHFVYCHLKDEINYLVPIENVGTVAISIGSGRRYSSAELERFRTIEPWVISIIRSHWSQPVAEKNAASERSDLHQKLSAGFQNFGRSQLTDRECDVAYLILQGHSSKSAASKLNISDETVKVHRRNIYKKLDIQSQSELFSLFLSALAAWGEGGDPLEDYHARPQ